MTHIFLNDNLPSHRHQRGISRYWNSVVDGVIKEFSKDVTIRSLQQQDFGKAKWVRRPAINQLSQIRGMNRLGLSHLLQKWDAHATENLIRQSGAQLTMSAYYGDQNPKNAQIFTVYDLIHEWNVQKQKFSTPADRAFIAQKFRCLDRSALLFAISHSTAQDIISLYPSLSDKNIVVTHLGVDEEFFDPLIKNDLPTRNPYFLYVGHRGGYKNFSRLLEAYGQSGLSNDIELHVISPVGQNFTADEQIIIKKYDLTHKVSLNTAVNEGVLQAAYAAAVAFIYPSEYEGFGLPILEAMASKTIVATSNTSSMPEAGGKSAFYFDPMSVDEIVVTLRRVSALSDSERLIRLTDGVHQAQLFSWKNCQQKTVQALKSLL